MENLKKFRASFYNSASDTSKKVDFLAKDSEDAFDKAMKMPEARQRWLYDNVTVEKWPKSPSPIGVRFRYLENGRRSYCNYLVIKARDEAHAVLFYNENYKGKRFYQSWPNKPDDAGNCVYGEVEKTYFCAAPGYDADATLDGKEEMP
ncbi:MAG: hypothetical protein IKO41_17850 [Lachnospiraceae bacterium]|nr:hypothetical protein [Lachnospiraceae bacterium]